MSEKGFYNSREQFIPKSDRSGIKPKQFDEMTRKVIGFAEQKIADFVGYFI